MELELWSSWWWSDIADNIAEWIDRRLRSRSVERLDDADNSAGSIEIVVGEASREFAPEAVAAFLRSLHVAA